MEQKFYLDNGEECSRSAYIRQEFNKDRSRKEIADELRVKYYIVYSATANMYNSHHPEGGSVGGSVSVAKVNSKFEFVDADGNVVDEDDAEIVPRNQLMKELFAAGVERGKIKDYFEVPYATVYAATKDTDAPEGTVKGGRKTLIHPETQEVVNRADYIRELYADGEGLSRKEIALELTKLTGELVDYATVWSATKPEKETEEVVEAEDTYEDVEDSVDEE